MAFNQDTADRICERMAGGTSLRAILAEEGMPGYSTVMTWLNERPLFRDNYAHAILMRAEVKFHELDDVSEEAVMAETAVQVNGLRLKADNIKWQLARMNSKKYGDRTTLAGDPDAPLQVATRTLSTDELMAIAAKGKE